MKRVAFHNLGCKVNDYETDIMQQLFVKNDFQVVPFSEKADIYVINTCTVTNMADRKSRQMLHRAKKMNPDAIVVAVGCYVQTSPEEAKNDSSVDIAIGNNKKSEVIEIIEDYISKNKPELFSNIIDINHTDVYETMHLDSTAERTRAYIKIQDGCNQFCSYCLIPFARGRVRSRDEADILEEIKGLGKKGYKEFVLTGIHVSSYGIEDPNDLSQNKLADLLEKIQKIDEVERIRLSSLEPRVVTREFAQRISKLDKLCPHFHLSLQSGCDETLKRMNRHYTTNQYKDGVSLLREYFDNPAITTDIIAGFPGESDEEFEKSFSFAREIGFYEMHIFKYSKRKGTVAATMKGQVLDSLKEERSKRLIELGDGLSKEFRKSYLNKVRPVLFEECVKIDGKDYIIGHTPEYIKVALDANDADSNEVKMVTLTSFLSDDVMLAK